MPASTLSDWFPSSVQLGVASYLVRRCTVFPHSLVLTGLLRLEANSGLRDSAEQRRDHKSDLMGSPRKAFLFSPSLLWSQTRGVRLMFLLLTLHLGNWWVNSWTWNYLLYFIFFSPKIILSNLPFSRKRVMLAIIVFSDLFTWRQREISLFLKHGA